MSKLDLLKPKVRLLAERLLYECKKAGIDIVITQTLRTNAEQNRLHALGRTKPGQIVTNAKGGWSLHNYGVAFDFCPVKKGKAVWNDAKLFEAVGRLGMRLGLEWGGSWKEFPDRPHFQFTAGYPVEDFLKKRVDWRKFGVE